MSTPLRVLIVEDSEDDALLLIRELRSGGYEPKLERVDTPTFGTELNTKGIPGMVKLEGRVKILLDINRVLNADEVMLLDKSA